MNFSQLFPAQNFKVFIKILKTKRLSLHCCFKNTTVRIKIYNYLHQLYNYTIKSTVMIIYIIHIKLKRHRFIKTFLNLSVFTIGSHALSVLMDGLTYLVVDYIVH